MTSELIEKKKKKTPLELHELRLHYQRLWETYQKILPKVDPQLIDDLLSREQQQEEEEDPDNRPMYTIEVFTREGVDTAVARWYIFKKSGMMPAIYDHGTHFFTDQKLTLETLRKYQIAMM